MTASIFREPAPETAGAPSSPRRAWVLVAALLAALLTLGALPVPMASAATAGFGLSVSNGGKSTISALNETVSLEAQISLPAGASVAAGSQTKLTLDPSLKRANNGPLPTGATAQSWDEATNTLTVTWGPLFPGSVYAASINAIPSGLASKLSTFQATATMTGSIDGIATTESDSSAAITVVGDAFPAEPRPAPAAGDWTLGSITLTTPAGIKVENSISLAQVAGRDTAFRNLQIATRWGQQVGSDGLMSPSWTPGPSVDYPGMHPNYSLASTTLQNDAASRVIAYGAFTAASANVLVSFTPPAGTVPGTYSVPVEILDDADVIASGVISIILPEPAAAELTIGSYLAPTRVSEGDVIHYGQSPGLPAVANAVKDITIVMAVPDQVTVRGFWANIDSVRAKSVEFTRDADLASATWSTLPLDAAGLITLADASGITGIRYVLNDARQLRSGLGGITLTAQVNDGVAAGTNLDFDVASATFLDPIAGEVELDLEGRSRMSAAVVADTGLPVLGAGDTSTLIGDLPNFDKVYANGNSFPQRLAAVGSGSAAVDKPYIFVVVPKGMSTSGLTAPQICAPYQGSGFPYYGGCAFGDPQTFPAAATDHGSIVLSDGSTLSYARATEGQLTQARGGYQQLQAATNFTMDALLEGEHKVLIGMGSAVQSEFTVDAARTRAGYAQVDLTADASYGSFSGVGSDIRSALASIGVTATSALVSEKSLTISPSTSLGSVTSIEGSEDAAPVVQGSGTATTRPGGNVNYEVELRNSGATVYKDFQFIDVLPRVGDSYTLNSGAPRGSAFDVNLTGNVKVLLNGVETADALIEYTTSTNPARFDASGADIPGDPWLPYTGSGSGATALRVTLAPTVEFAPGDKITLSFDGSVPASAPRDGTLANNSIAYRFQAGTGSWIVAETTAVGVRSSAPAGDTALLGRAFLDLNDNGLQDAGEPGANGAGVTLQLYKVVSGTPVAVPPAVTPNTDAGVDGVFSFIGLEPNETYLVKPISINPNVTFPASALDADGFLKYTRITDAAANGEVDTTQFVGESRFKIGDAIGEPKWIKDLRLPVIAVTTVDGTVVITDATGSPVAGASEYAAGFTVRLKAGATVVATTITDAEGEYVFDSLEDLLPGDYTLTFEAPEGSGLEASGSNNAAVFSGGTGGAAGAYKLTAMQPGTGAHDVTVFYTDLVAPHSAITLVGGTVVGGGKVNPTSATLTGVDHETRVVGYDWKVLSSESAVSASGTATAASPTAVIPGTLADGTYRIVVTATDLLGNVSSEATQTFVVDTTAPVLATDIDTFTYTKLGEATPVDSAGWIGRYGATASDGAGTGLDGAIAVDASAVRSAVGSYPVVFTATDLAGNVSTRTVTYVVDYVGDPTVMLGTDTVQVEQGTTAPTDQGWRDLFQVTAAAGDPSATIEVLELVANDVDMSTAGTYHVTFVATDSLGASSLPKRGSVIVKDTVAPSLELGQAAVSYGKGDSQVADDAAWIALLQPAATDTGSGMPTTGTLGITIDASAVDYSVSGTYPVLVTATDNAGNATTVTAEYTVAFSGDPSIMLGSATVTHELGDAEPASGSDDWVKLFGAVGQAAAGATVASVVADASAVDLTMIGDYQVVFTVTDSYGNVAVRSGTLRVEDTTAPEVALARSTGKHAVAAPSSPWTSNDWIAFFGATADDGAGSGIDVSSWTIQHAVNWLVPGDYPVTFTVTDTAGNTSSEVTGVMTIEAPAAPAENATAPQLAQSGAEIGTLLGAGLAAVALGALFLFFLLARRRRREEDEELADS